MDRDQIDFATKRGETFVQEYFYKLMDSPQRSELVKMYKDESSVIYNGTGFRGLGQIQNCLKELPATSHRVDSFDVHPVPGAKPGTLLINVSGTVKFAAIPTLHVFSQTFTLAPDPTAGDQSKFFIYTDMLRITATS
eukprot:TRINITY_DN12766_c0_g1_i1.p1 TRINITY_DN12766_c0_g1~~TRINITY_DN12766_c0_g1_i1.p1  ORF type:complete len:137 (+),score=28.11 TRINITY_DN12766_c0_g1_i1:14-424(+)